MKLPKWLRISQSEVNTLAETSGAVTPPKPSLWSRISGTAEVGNLDSNPENGQYVENPTASVRRKTGD